MRGVAAEVGVAPMSLYHHVRDRDDLLARMVGHLLDEAPDPATDHQPWQDRLRSVFLALRFAAHSHRRTFPLALEYPDAEGLRELRLTVADALSDAGVPPEHAIATDAVVWTLLLGFVVREALGHLRRHPTQGADRAAAAVLAAVEHHVAWVVDDPGRAHPDDPATAWGPPDASG